MSYLRANPSGRKASISLYSRSRDVKSSRISVMVTNQTCHGVCRRHVTERAHPVNGIYTTLLWISRFPRKST